MTPLRHAVLIMVAVVGWCAAAVAPSALAQEDVQPLAGLELDALTPRIVTVGGPPELVVAGEVVNRGDRALAELAVRLQRDVALTDDVAARAGLERTADAPFVTDFVALDGTLAPGERRAFRLAVPLGAGPEGRALQLTDPGVYPLLVNFNGTPEFGGPARLATVPLLLPVFGVPGQPPRTAARPPLAPAPLTVVWPLVSEPSRLLSGPGAPLLLASPADGTDPVREQITPGGRLDGLVGALEEVVVPGSPLAAAVCVAVDPELLDTVAAMAAGYRVAGPSGIVDGSGSADAARWLARLRDVVAGRCVLPLPYADADLVALSRAGLTDLAALATGTGADLAAELLGVQPLTGLVWPADGLLDERTLADLTALRAPLSLLLAPEGLATAPVDADTATLPGGPRAVIADPLLSTALAPATPLPLPAAGVVDPAAGTTAVAARPTGTDRPLAAQDGIGALAYRALADDRRPVLLVPPRRWQVSRGEATALLRTAAQVVTAGFFTPRDLAGSVAGAPGPPVALDYPAAASGREVGTRVTEEAGRSRDALRDLQVATERDATVGLEPAALLDPLRLALLRSVSTAWRDEPIRAAELVAGVSGRLDELQSSVRIVPPPGSYTLASSNSPLLLTVENGLPVSVDVQLELARTPGLRTGPVGVEQIPARSNRQFVVPAEVTRAGQFTVEARLTTPGGTPLGRPTTLQLQSTTFGTVTVALTAGAAAVLVALVGRRIVRRVRAARAAP